MKTGDKSSAAVTAGQIVTQDKLERARKFRKEPTGREADVWSWLRDRKMLGCKWRRQQVIEGFIADFYCAELHLALEIDGGIHQSGEARQYDVERDAVFAGKGIRTIRINDVECTRERVESVIGAVLRKMNG